MSLPIKIVTVSPITTFLSQLVQNNSVIYPSGVKRVVVKGDYYGNLRDQVHAVSGSTFTTIGRNYDELFDNIEFGEF